MQTVIAWDKETDTAVEPERTPTNGEWCRITRGKRVVKRQWFDPVDPEPVQDSKLVLAKNILQSLPLGTRRKLSEIRDNADYNIPAQANNGDTADLLLTIISTGNPIDVLSPNFDNLMAWMTSQTPPLITRKHVRKLKELQQ